MKEWRKQAEASVESRDKQQALIKRIPRKESFITAGGRQMVCAVGD